MLDPATRLVPAAAMKAHAATMCEAAGTPATVLVIDDDDVQRMVLCKTAERAGFVATSAATFGAAMALLRQHTYTVITLDLSLGARNGLDVMHALVGIGCRTPIVIVSGANAALRSETVALAGLIKLDVRHSLPKPVDLALLRRVLSSIREESATLPVVG
ncbi:response regulator [Rhodoplanes serenus]|uniref:Response regulator n=1 Tax=Rhodoplanes serenus TaxID=200615 RepID=A0A9X4XK48_9BRAD|nr:response regulator [Rhodoplanes serenus]MTW15651.1 response regulator [Rhodoplanes serenus]